VFVTTTHKELSDEQELDLKKLIDRLEEDDDVVAVYHNAQ
jgi:transcriptional/translational regulatory protein YebC/TACO1